MIPYELLCEIGYLQEAQLSQSGRVMLGVVETFANLINIMRNETVESTCGIIVEKTCSHPGRDVL